MLRLRHRRRGAPPAAPARQRLFAELRAVARQVRGPRGARDDALPQLHARPVGLARPPPPARRGAPVGRLAYGRADQFYSWAHCGVLEHAARRERPERVRELVRRPARDARRAVDHARDGHRPAGARPAHLRAQDRRARGRLQAAQGGAARAGEKARRNDPDGDALAHLPAAVRRPVDVRRGLRVHDEPRLRGPRPGPDAREPRLPARAQRRQDGVLDQHAAVQLLRAKRRVRAARPRAKSVKRAGGKEATRSASHAAHTPSRTPVSRS